MKQLRSSSLFWAEEGFSTVGMVLALLISISLIFTAARVYEINSCSSRVQEVADAAALAAENTVGEFYLVAGICDAVLLSLSLPPRVFLKRFWKWLKRPRKLETLFRNPRTSHLSDWLKPCPSSPQ